MKFNILFIITDHFNTLRNYNENENISMWDIVIFYILPLIVAGLIMVLCDNINSDHQDSLVNILVTVFSIFIGLLLNLLVLNVDLKDKFKTSEIKQIVAKQTFINISYGIVISILGVIFGLCTFIDIWKFPQIFTYLSYFIMGHFVLTLFMILKRVYKLFETI